MKIRFESPPTHFEFAFRECASSYGETKKKMLLPTDIHDEAIPENNTWSAIVTNFDSYIFLVHFYLDCLFSQAWMLFTAYTLQNNNIPDDILCGNNQKVSTYYKYRDTNKDASS